MHSKMEEEALQAHMSYGGGPEAEAAFWAYEYNYHSSVATIIHRRAKIHCHIPGMDKTNVKDLTTEENRTIAELEHKDGMRICVRKAMSMYMERREMIWQRYII